MKTLDNLRPRPWARTPVENGTRFSLVASKQTVVAVPASNCHGCANHHLHFSITKRDHCMYLPPCSNQVFLPDTPEALAAYVAAQLED